MPACPAVNATVRAGAHRELLYVYADAARDEARVAPRREAAEDELRTAAAEAMNVRTAPCVDAATAPTCACVAGVATRAAAVCAKRSIVGEGGGSAGRNKRTERLG
jgi:hypothetical protein